MFFDNFSVFFQAVPWVAVPIELALDEKKERDTVPPNFDDFGFETTIRQRTDKAFGLPEKAFASRQTQAAAGVSTSRSARCCQHDKVTSSKY